MKQKNKKSQLKMAETIAILFVFFVLITIGILIYVGYKRVQTQTMSDEFKEDDRIEIAKKIPSLPEIRCSTSSREVSNCIDVLKLKAFKELINDSYSPIDINKIKYYNSLLKKSNLTVKSIYPNNNTKINFYDSYNNATDQELSYKSIQVPVSLYFPTKDEYGIGELNVAIYG